MVEMAGAFNPEGLKSGYDGVVFDIMGTLSELKPEFSKVEKVRTEHVEPISQSIIPYLVKLVDAKIRVAIVTTARLGLAWDWFRNKLTDYFGDETKAEDYLKKMDIYAEHGLVRFIDGKEIVSETEEFRHAKYLILTELGEYPEALQISRDDRDVILSFRPIKGALIKPDDIGKILREIIERNNLGGSVDVSASTMACTVIPKRASKRAAVKDILRRLFRRGKKGDMKLLVLGDAPPDLPMIVLPYTTNIFVTNPSHREGFMKVAGKFNGQFRMTKLWGAEATKCVLENAHDREKLEKYLIPA